MEPNDSPLVPTPSLKAFAYQKELRRYLEQEAAELWEWHASDKSREEHAEIVRLNLLKSAYRLEAPTHPQLYEAAGAALKALGLDIPVTIYQGAGEAAMNAGLMFLPNEAHIIFQGPLLQQLSIDEQKAILGHELAHYLFWTLEDGCFYIASNVLQSMAVHPNAAPSHLESLRRFDLYTELYCDRGAATVMDSYLTAVACLVKTTTGLMDADPASYLRQADEIFSKGVVKTEQYSHPETYIRARALKLWSESDPKADVEIVRMLEGKGSMDELDLLEQREMTLLTRSLMASFLTPQWLRSPQILAHTRLFFEDFDPARVQDFDEARLKNIFQGGDKKLKDYFCYLLLDLVVVDRELEEGPLAAALLMAESWGAEQRFAEIARKEMKLTKKVITRICKEKVQIVKAAEVSTAKEGHE